MPAATTWVLLYLVGMVGSEALLLGGHVRYAVWGYGAIVLVCVIGPLRDARHAELLIIFAFIPVFRLVNLGMPAFGETTMYWLPAIYLPFIPALVFVMRSYSSVGIEFGLRAGLIGLPVAIVIGIGLAEGVMYLVQPDPLVPDDRVVTVLVFAVVMIVCVGFVEELMFRGALQQTLETAIGEWPGIVITSLVFGVMHGGFGGLTGIGVGVVLGIILGVIYARTRSLAVVTVIHGTYALFLLGIIPLIGSPLARGLAAIG